MKKILKYIICVLLCVTALNLTPFMKVNAEPFDIKSESAILIDFHSQNVIYSKNETEHLTIASMTKIMLLDLCFDALENGEYSLTDVICVSENASGMGGSQVFLEGNAKYSAEDLLKSIIVASANDASVAMAEFLFGSEQECVYNMNLKAKEYGMNDTHYSNCTGLPMPEQYSCAKDVANVFSKLLSHKEYFKYSGIWMDEIKHPKGNVTGLTNTNKLIRFYDGCDSGKTGFTKESGFCIACSAKRGNMRLVSVVIKAPSSKERFAEVSSMFNYAFANYTNKMVLDKTKPLNIEYKVEGGKKNSAQIVAEEDYYIFGNKNSKDNVIVDFIPGKGVKAPLKKGDKIGKLVIYKNGEEIQTVNCLINEDVKEKTYFDCVKDVLRHWTV